MTVTQNRPGGHVDEHCGTIDGEAYSFVIKSPHGADFLDYRVHLTEPTREIGDSRPREWNVDVYEDPRGVWKGSFGWDSVERKLLRGLRWRHVPDLGPGVNLENEIERLCLEATAPRSSPPKRGT